MTVVLFAGMGGGCDGLEVRLVTRYRAQFAIMGPQYISHYVPGYVARPDDRIVGHAKVELQEWSDRDLGWLERAA